MNENIRVILQRIEDNEYSGDNADALRHLDIEEIRQYLDAIDSKVTKITDLLNHI